MKRILILIIVISISLTGCVGRKPNEINKEIDYQKQIVEKGNTNLLDKNLEEDKLLNASPEDLRIIRNTIYAKYGYKFSSKDLFEHFTQFKWYQPSKKNVEQMLSEIDKNNIQLLLKLELNKNLVGVWQDSNMMASGWSDTYQFFADGRYVFHYNQMICDKRDLTHEGIWKLEGTKLILTANKKRVLVGGELIKATGSCGSEYELIDAEEKIQEITPPLEVQYNLQYIEEEENSDGIHYQKIIIGKEYFWRLSINPNAYD